MVDLPSSSWASPNSWISGRPGEIIRHLQLTLFQKGPNKDRKADVVYYHLKYKSCNIYIYTGVCVFFYLGKGKNHLLESTLVKGNILVFAKCTSSTLPETNSFSLKKSLPKRTIIISQTSIFQRGYVTFTCFRKHPFHRDATSIGASSRSSTKVTRVSSSGTLGMENYLGVGVRVVGVGWVGPI